MNNRLSFTRIPQYCRLMRLDRPIGIYLLMWPTLWAFMLASTKSIDVGLLTIFVAGVVIMRSAGCVINDYADRNFDGKVSRTKARPLAVGELEPKEALQLFIVLIALAFCLVLMLNWQTMALSVIALLLASAYPFMKRYTHFPQVVLGAAYSFSIPMVITAILGFVPLWGWVLFAANLLWTIAYDTMYAMVDREDDIKIGVKSTAVFFGSYDRAAIACLHLLVVLLLILVGYLKNLSVYFYLGLAIMAVLFLYENWMIRKRNKEACFQAFLHSHKAGLTLLVGLAAHYFFS